MKKRREFVGLLGSAAAAGALQRVARAHQAADASRRLPTACVHGWFAEQGGLISYCPNSDLYRQAAVYDDKILKGAKPSDLPVQRPTKFELVVNLRTAKAVGIPCRHRC